MTGSKEVFIKQNQFRISSLIRRSDDNLYMMLAQIMASQVHSVSIHDVDKDWEMNDLPQGEYVEIVGDFDSSSIFREITESAEFRTIEAVMWGVPRFREDAPYVSIDFGWDDQTRRRVKALYFANRSRLYQERADSRSDPKQKKDLEIAAEDYLSMASGLLGNCDPLSLDDIHFLIGKIVERVLENREEHSTA